MAAASRAPYRTLDHDELLERARNEGEARAKNAKLLVAANLAKIRLKGELERALQKLEKLDKFEKAAAKEARAREKRASQLAKAAAGKRVVVQIGPEQIEMARGMYEHAVAISVPKVSLPI